jgi:predicted branched-subunit amino acid permease
MTTSATDLPDGQSSLRIALRGMRDAVGLPTITIVFSLIGIGGLARDVGYPMLAGALSSALIWAGPAQVLLFGAIATGASLPAAAIGVLFSSLRFLPMTISLVPLLNEPRKPLWKLLLAAHLVAITNWVEGMRRLPDLPPEQRYPYFMGFGSAVMLSGTIGTGAGYYLVGALPPLLAAALLFTTPMFFTVNLVAPAKHWLDWAPLVLAVALLPVASQTIGTDYDLAVAGFAGGSIAYGFRRVARGRAA